MAKPHPWPAAAWPHHKSIIAHQAQLENILSLCLTEGIKNHNYQLIELLLPRLLDLTTAIRDSCQAIQQLLPADRRGRLPKWHTITMDINALGLQLTQYISEISELYPEHRFINIDLLLQLSLGSTKKIDHLLNVHPYTSDMPETFLELIEQLD